MSAAGVRDVEDRLAVEAPLEIRVRTRSLTRVQDEVAVTITMRTPGDDAELGVGFLFTEGLLARREDVVAVETPDPERVVVVLAPGVAFDRARFTRAFATTSACGVCGKGSLAELRVPVPAPLAPKTPIIAASMIPALPDQLRAAQPTFAATGGLHAAGLFDVRGTLLGAREDVGRHNAVDKLVGGRFLEGALPACEEILVVSGRASFELAAKAIAAGIPILAAVGAPSTLAVSLAAEHGLTLVGFVRDGRFNVYTGGERIDCAAIAGLA